MKPRPSILLPIGFLGAVLWGFWDTNPPAEEQARASFPHVATGSRSSESTSISQPSGHTAQTAQINGLTEGPTTHSAWIDATEIPKLRAQHSWHQSLHRAASPELARLSIDQMIERLPEEYQQPAADYRRELNTLEPEFRRYICWATDTPDDVVQTYRRIEIEGGMAPGEARIQANQFLGTGHWNRTALNGSGNDVQGRPITLTWSIAPDGTNVPGLNGATASASNLRSWLSGIYGTNSGAPENEPWFELFEQAFAELSAQTGLRFVYQSLDTGSAFSSFFAPGSTTSRGDIRIGARALDGPSGVLAFAYAPDYGDMVFDSADTFYNNTSNDSIRFINVLTHELGHALGLDHVCPINTTKLMEPFATTNFRGLQFDDVYSLQRQYGDASEVGDTRSSNDASTLAEDLEFTEELTAGWQWLSIDDNSDVDYFRITTAANRKVTVRVIPSNPLNQGSTYLEGPQNGDGSCSAGTAFNPTNQQNLTLELLAGDGVTVMAESILAGGGLTEEISDATLPEGGNYFIRVNGDSANAAQLYRLELLVEALADAPLVKVTAQSLVDESNEPNNAAADPGETIVLAVDLLNSGALDATDLQGTLSGPASFTGFTTSSPTMDLATGATGQMLFTFAVDGQCGDTIDLTLDLTSAGGYSTSATIPISLGAFSSGVIIDESFDTPTALPAGWSSNTTGASENWTTSTSNPDSGSGSAFVEAISEVGEAILTSPAATLGPVSNLTFRHNYNLESGYDGGVLEASLDGGAWFDLPNASGVVISGDYNDNISGGFSSPISNRDAWSGNSGGYTTVSADLPTTWTGQDIRFRWISGSDSSLQAVGWYLDSVNLTSDVPLCAPFRPALSITASGSVLEEGNQASSISGTLSTPLPLTQDVPITLMTTGTADVADLNSSLDLILPAGQTSITFEIFAVSDTDIEGIEDLLISIPDDQPGFSPSTSSQFSVTIEEPAQTFTTWQNQFPGLDSAPEADDDGDRWSNLFEYAFGTHPQSPSSLPGVTHQLTPATLELTLPEGNIPDDIQLIGETSTDLFSWDTNGVTQNPNGFSVSRDGPTRYLRLRAVLSGSP